MKNYFKKDTFFFFVLLIISCYILFLNLGSLSVRMWDEARNGINAIEMLQNGNLFVTHFDNQPDMWNSKPPFMIWMIALSMKVFGITTFALRLPSVLACLTIIIYGYWFAKKHIQSISLGFIFGLVLVTSIGFIDYHASRNGDFDTMLAMWIFLYITQFYLYTTNQKKINLVLFSLFLGLAILTKGIAACMILPGLAIYMLTSKKNLVLLKTVNIYVFSFLGLLIGIVYYLIREQLNPGYIDAVIFNEITGRYSATNEGHTGSIWYYYELLRDQHYKYWFYVLPITALYVLVRGNQLFKNLLLFLLLQASVYFIVITVSHTKLPWYDIPLYPIFAMIIATGFAQLQKDIIEIKIVTNNTIKHLSYTLLIISLFVLPLQNILATSIRGEKETYYHELFYGDFINKIFKMYPNQKRILVSSEGYNPHLIFYAKEKATKGKIVKITSPYSTEYNYNDTIIITESAFFPKLKEDFVLDTIFVEDNVNYLVSVISKEEFAKNRTKKLLLRKINEIKNNPEWLEAIKQKATKNNTNLENQIMLDAKWTLENEESKRDVK